MMTFEKKQPHKKIKPEIFDETLKSQIKNQLTRRYNWNATKYGHPAFLNYSFDIKKNPPLKEFEKYGAPIPFTEKQRQKAKLLLQYYADVANLHFNEDKGGDINKKIHFIFLNYLKTTPNSRMVRGLAYYPNPSSNTTRTIWINLEQEDNLHFNNKGKGLLTLSNLIGSVLGLKHPYYQAYTNKVSVMSYYDEPGYKIECKEEDGYDRYYYPSGPQMYDIVAIQYLYGANLNTRTGNTIYGFNSNSDRPYLTARNANDPLIFCVWDAGGIDTFDFSGYHQDQRINLNSHEFSDVGGLKNNVSIAYRVIIENAIGGTGDDTLIGNEVDNILRGGKGADLIYGERGCDRLLGGEGNDLLYGGEGADKLEGGKGMDQLRGGKGADYLLGEEGNDLLFGGEDKDCLLGGQGADQLYGEKGDDILLGGSGNDELMGGKGADRLTGGRGKDRFIYQYTDDSSTLFADTISDFEVGRDKIDLSLITNEIKNIELVEKFTSKNEIEIKQDYSELHNITGLMIHFSDSIKQDSFHQDMLIRLAGHKTLTAQDFIFSDMVNK